MERTTAAGGGAGRRVIAFGADGQTHQCRFPDRRLDPAGQHHDARAGRGAAARRTAPAAIDTAGDCAIAVAASDADGNPRAGGGQETIGAEVLGEARSSGSACAGRTGTVSSRGRQRLSFLKSYRPYFCIEHDLWTNQAVWRKPVSTFCGSCSNVAAMPLHLIKLAVGCDSVKELKGWVAERMQTASKKACRFIIFTSPG